jgi:zinc transport system ATP-binding protein
VTRGAEGTTEDDAEDEYEYEEKAETTEGGKIHEHGASRSRLAAGLAPRVRPAEGGTAPGADEYDTMPDTDNVIEIRDLWFSYEGTPVLREVNLSVGHRELVCMVGPNGGGKTTLLKLMLGLLRPDRGTVRVFGRDPRLERSRIGYVPQHARFDPSFPASALDVVLMGRLGRKVTFGPHGREDRAAAEAALAEVGMLPLARRSFAELSGGQRQRVTIARALAGEPDVLLLDEPTAGLDVGVENEFQALLHQVSRRMTIVLVSHDIGFVTEHVGKVVCVQGTVAVHPTAALTGQVMRDLYGQDIRLVRHDHNCQTDADAEDAPTLGEPV